MLPGCHAERAMLWDTLAWALLASKAIYSLSMRGCSTQASLARQDLAAHSPDTPCWNLSQLLLHHPLLDLGIETC